MYIHQLLCTTLFCIDCTTKALEPEEDSPVLIFYTLLPCHYFGTTLVLVDSKRFVCVWFNVGF